MRFNVKEEIIAITPQWTGERFPDGRPKVADKYLKALEGMTLEEVWKPIFLKGYENQFEGELRTLHANKKLIGRAVTSAFAPARPDLHETLFAVGMEEGRKGNYNQWVIDSLVEGDVVVADMFDKIYKGTFIGGNLTTAISARTKTGGAVVWGGIRDVEQMERIDTQVYYRGIDPTPIRDFVMLGFNTAVRIGKAVCLPGDIVFGAGGGVLFIPSHLVQEVVEGAAKSHIKDVFGFEMLTANIFTTAEIDRNTWTEEMLDMLTAFIRDDERGREYRDLDWTVEYELARNGDPDDTQTAL
ncbi:RraA family protein [Cohnella fermenti]|uniref:RraA family protein n=1 Tax=Cohnella fermenti TaxID=2565925 RepID=A0A4S4BUH9_9BACL|nr:RraA family protein [Cohnella fermenti]THF76569.1 RraA family protein [Cohnella fermenti]